MKEMALNDMILNTLIHPIELGARKFGQTVVPVSWLKKEKNHKLLKLVADGCEVVVGCGLIFSGRTNGCCDLFVADSQKTMDRLPSILRSFKAKGREIFDPEDENISMEQVPEVVEKLKSVILEAQREIGRLFGYREEKLISETSPYQRTIPNEHWIFTPDEALPELLDEILPLNSQSIREIEIVMGLEAMGRSYP